MSSRRLPNVGDTLDLCEEHYCYGVGRLRLKVTAVEGITMFDGQPWLAVRGVPMRVLPDCPQSEVRAGGERPVLVRASALRTLR